MSKRLRYWLAGLLSPKQRMLEISILALIRYFELSAGHIRKNKIRIIEIPGFARPGDGRKIVAALRLIERLDSRRSTRIAKEISAVVLIKCRNHVACYQRIGRLCLIDLAKLNQESQALLAKRSISPELVKHELSVPEEVRLAVLRLGAIACLLVHESTHGLIESRQILYLPKTKDRIESLCKDEERRFRKCLLPNLKELETFLQPFLS